MQGRVTPRATARGGFLLLPDVHKRSRRNLHRFRMPCMHHVARHIVLTLTLVTLLASVARADEATDHAIWQLQKAMLVHRNGDHNLLLRALRQMRDPKLEPLFSELIQRRHPGLKIHGILGLAEIADPPHLDLALVADIKEPTTQAVLIGQAIDDQLLTTDAAEQLARWPGLDPKVRVLVIGKLVSDQRRVDPSTLDAEASHENLALRGMASLLQLQLGKAEARKTLDAINESDSPRKESTRALILQSALKYEFDKIGDWALQVAREKDVDRAIGRQGLRVAMRFNTPGAVELWLERIGSTTSEAERTRLALLALDIADRLEPRVFSAIVGDRVPVIDAIGKAGLAIAEKKPVADALIGLIAQNNYIASGWVLGYAEENYKLDPDGMRRVLEALIRDGDNDEPRFRAHRLKFAALAAENLHELDAQGADRLRQLVADSSELLKEVMLMGLIRSSGDDPQRVIEGIAFEGRTARSLALLLRSKHADKISDEDAKALVLVMSGGGGLEEPLRLQAAWTYLKLTHQDRVALARVLGENIGS